MRILWSIVRFFIFLFLGWLLFAWLSSVHWCLPWLVMAMCGANILFAIATASRAAWLVDWSRFRWFEIYVSWLCLLNSLEPIPSNRLNTTVSQRTLRSSRDFGIAIRRATQVVRGHDRVIESVFDGIQQNENLRLKRKSKYNRTPLASFLLIGERGIGKKYLCRVAAKLLNRHGRLEVYDCRLLTPTALESICATVREQTSCFFLFENIEQADAGFFELFERVLGVARIKNPSGDSNFHESVIAFSTSSLSSEIGRAIKSETSSAKKTSIIRRFLQDETQINGKFLSLLTDVLFCEPLNDVSKAEIAELLMKKTCDEHGIQLRVVDPEILAVQILRLGEDRGVEMLPQQIQSLLRKPLLEASASQMNQLALRIK